MILNDLAIRSIIEGLSGFLSLQIENKSCTFLCLRNNHIFLPSTRTPEHEEAPGPEFVSAGVSLFVGGGACGGGVLYRQRTAPAPHAPAHLVPPATHDRLWMWKCFNYT